MYQKIAGKYRIGYAETPPQPFYSVIGILLLRLFAGIGIAVTLRRWVGLPVPASAITAIVLTVIIHILSRWGDRIAHEVKWEVLSRQDTLWERLRDIDFNWIPPSHANDRAKSTVLLRWRTCQDSGSDQTFRHELLKGCFNCGKIWEVRKFQTDPE